MKTVREIKKLLADKGVYIGKTQIIMDIRLNKYGLKASKIGNIYAIEDKVAKEYINQRIKHKKKNVV